ncbi:LysE family translocator [Billgrantia kenyensis]|uniref:LysE family translocator n=1 Tax=Billgrantia kenyensis TaxID=321266 RepID=A0A7V9W4R7_9GAMM|nr:LysE family translocator [Halomonas kenyensis]MBA2781024.1 LysE family translocator [Halomonas kenyensis]MCG6663751.1 LysE family translocator [Halomonas kenyensis]
MTLEYLVSSLIVVAAPGTGVLYILSISLARGMRACFVAALGCTLGIVPHLLAAVTGLASLLHASETAFELLKYLGVAYLLYLAWRMLRSREALVPSAASAPLPTRRLIATGILINLLNPKLTLFFFAFLPQFVQGKEAPLTHMLGLSLTFMVMTFVVFIAYGLCVAAARQKVASRPSVLAWLRGIFSAGFLALAVRLAMAER